MSDTTIQPWLRGILRCPSCRSEFAPESDSGPERLDCTNAECRRSYRIEGGIPVLLVDEATIRDA